MKTNTFDINDFEFYSFRTCGKISLSFTYKEKTEFQVEGDIHLGDGCYGGESYKYVDFIEISENEDKISEEDIEVMELFLENNLNYIFSNTQIL